MPKTKRHHRELSPKKDREDKKYIRQKELMKALETPEEKRDREREREARDEEMTLINIELFKLVYVQDMVMICEDEIAKLRKLEQMNSGGSANRREGIHSSVSSDVATIFNGKTYGQLVALEQEIIDRISSKNPGDITWWETALQQLKAHMARTRLRDKHQAVLRKKLFQLKQEQAEQISTDTISYDSNISHTVIDKEIESEDTEQDKDNEEESDTLIAEEDLLQLAYEAYDNGLYSPKLYKLSDISDELHICGA